MSLHEVLNQVENEGKEVLVKMKELFSVDEENGQDRFCSEGGDAAPASVLLDLIRLKSRLHASYCTHLAFMSAMKVSGMSIAGHEAVRNLALLRLTLEKIRPVERRLEYQIERMLRIARSKEDEVDALSVLRPNPAAMVAPKEIDVDQEGVYQPPQLAAVHFEEEGAKSKVRRDRERRRTHLERSVEVQDILEEFSDKPETVRVAGRRETERDVRIRQYEEDHFLRLNIPEASNKKKRRRNSIHEMGLKDQEDFQTLLHLSDKVVNSSGAVNKQESADRNNKRTSRKLIKRKASGARTRRPSRTRR